MKYIATFKGKEFEVVVDHERRITIDGEPYEIDFRRLPSGGVTSLLMNHRSIAADVEDRGDHWEVLIEGELYAVKVEDERAYRLSRQRTHGLTVNGEAMVASPMPGIIVAVPVAVGDTVHTGQKVIILESMKMENELRSPLDGVVTHVFVEKGASVDKDQPLVGISQPQGDGDQEQAE
jgi:biotin carboxyl carrier protein